MAHTLGVDRPRAVSNTQYNRRDRSQLVRVVVALFIAASVLPSLLNIVSHGRQLSTAVAIETPVSGVFKLLYEALLGLTEVIAALVLLSSLKVRRARSILRLSVYLLPWAVIESATYLKEDHVGIAIAAYPLIGLAVWASSAALDSLEVIGIAAALISTFSLAYFAVRPGSAAVPESGGQESKALVGHLLLAGPFQHPNTLGVALALAFPCIGWITRKKVRWYAYCATGLSIILSASRTSIIATGIVLTTILISSSGSRRGAVAKEARRGGAPLALLFCVLALLGPYFVLTSPSLKSYSGRGQIWAASLETWRSSPWLGKGVDFFSQIAQYDNSFGPLAAHGHNLVVNSLVTGGVAMAAAVAATLAFLAKRAISFNRSGLIAPSLVLAAFLAIGWFEVATDFANVGLISWAVWVPFAFILLGTTEQAAQSDPSLEAKELATTSERVSRPALTPMPSRSSHRALQFVSPTQKRAPKWSALQAQRARAVLSSDIAMSGIARLITLPITIVAAFATTDILIHAVGSGSYGQVALVSTIFLVLPFADLGIGSTITNAFAEKRSTGDLSLIVLSSIRILLLSGAVVATLAAIVALTTGWTSLVGINPMLLPMGNLAVALALVFFAAGLPIGVAQRALLGSGMNRSVTLLNAMIPVLILGLTVFFYLVSAPLWVYAVTAPAATLGVGLLSFGKAWRVTRLGRLGLRIRDIARVRSLRGTRIIYTAAPMFVIMLGLPLALQTDRFVIAHRSNAQVLSTYSLGGQIYAALYSVIATAGMSLWPYFAGRRVQGLSIRVPWVLSLIGAGVAGVLVSGSFVALGPWAANLVGGNKVHLTREISLWFGVFLLVQAIQLPTGMLLTTNTQLRFQSVCVVLMCIANLSLSWTLTPQLGAIGPLVGSSLSVFTFQLLPGILYVRLRVI